MKKLRIGLLLVLSVLAGARLSATENPVLDNGQQPVLTPKAAPADTERMTWEVRSDYRFKDFYFYGEEGATYKVEWGDGETETYTGKGANSQVECGHRYSEEGTYTVLLYGVLRKRSENSLLTFKKLKR